MKIKLSVLFMALTVMACPLFSQEVFVPTSKGDITPVSRAVITGTKTSGKALLAAYGAKLTSSLVIDGKQSTTILPKSSAIFYVFNPSKFSVQGWKMVSLKSKKKNRELPYMKTSAYSGSKTDLDDVPMMTTKITDEIYEMRPMADIKDGDYAIVYLENGVPTLVYDFRVEGSLPPYPRVSEDVIMAEFNPSAYTTSYTEENKSESDSPATILRWYFDSDPRGARIFYRVISNIPKQVKNTNESYMTTTPLEETKSLNIPGLTYQNSADVVIEIKVTKRGYEEQIKRYNVRQALDQQEISGFFELVPKDE